MLKLIQKLPTNLRPAVTGTLIGCAVWLTFALDWLWWGLLRFSLPAWLADAGHLLVFTAMFVTMIGWIAWARSKPRLLRNAVLSVALLPIWQYLVYLADLLDFRGLAIYLADTGLVTVFLVGLAWVIWYVDTIAQAIERVRKALRLGLTPWPTEARQSGRGASDGEGGDSDRVPRPGVPDAAFMLAPGLASPNAVGLPAPGEKLWNPLDPEAWYFGKRARKLNQSLLAMLAYTLLFLIAFLLITQMRGCLEIYEMPHGGGEPKPKAQVVKIKKIIKKKFVINPYSAVVFNPPPIDEVKLQLKELTDHTYQVGYGKGKGAGFAEGTKKGKVRFIRLEYAGGDWDLGMGVGGDLNMLIQYGIITGHKVEGKTESRTVAQLRNFPVGKSPPMVYMTGQKSIHLSKSELETLREYLIDKHGMIFASNGGSRHFHSQFFAMMRKIVPHVDPVRVPLDDVIHRVPQPIPFLPYVAPHGGKDAWGWKVDGRWVCYYHPGDIGDAWGDDHAGVRRDVWEACYHLGANVIFYAHAEYSRWLEARRKE